MPTALELKLIHLAVREAGLLDEHYRMILRSVAGVDTAKKLGQIDFENVMAVIEDSGFRHMGKPADYWRSIVASRGSLCGARVVHKIAELAAAQKYDLAGMCLRVSADRVSRVDHLYPHEGSNLIEALKAIHRREAAKQAAVSTTAEPAEAPAIARPEARTASASSPAPDVVPGLGGAL